MRDQQIGFTEFTGSYQVEDRDNAFLLGTVPPDQSWAQVTVQIPAGQKPEFVNGQDVLQLERGDVLRFVECTQGQFDEVSRKYEAEGWAVIGFDATTFYPNLVAFEVEQAE